MTDSKLIPQLVELNGPRAGRVHELPYGDHTVGRGAAVEIALEHHDVSRRHARLQVGPEGVLVHDLGSKNGVYANGTRVDAPVMLTHGAILAFGDLQVSLGHPASQVARALTAGGEATMTATRTSEHERGGLSSLMLPVVGVLVFGGLVAALLML
jgi:pSer/pThr/pTyr-binding forkhead associated (FHA) protein